MSTLTSLVKSCKRKIIKTKTEEPAEREQKLPESARSSASKRGFQWLTRSGSIAGCLLGPKIGWWDESYMFPR